MATQAGESVLVRDETLDQSPLYMGLDLSTQQLKAIVIDSRLKLVHEAKADFDADFGEKYAIEKGVLTNAAENEVFAPPALWLDALNLVLDRLEEAGLDYGRIMAISGAGMQHGTVFWNADADTLLGNLDPSSPLAPQLDYPKALAHEMSPNWQDASTQIQCDAFDACLGSAENLAQVTGSKAHHRFSGPQIMRYREKYPEHYEKTARVSLVSSFLASVFSGKVAPIDIGDVGGMNLWDLTKGAWDERLLALAAGGKQGVGALRKKLGDDCPALNSAAALGMVSNYFVTRYGFNAKCAVLPFTGDNPATILSLPLRAQDAIVSLGTSTTFLMSTPEFKPDPAYHFMNHPTTKGLYMFMLCYKNGGLAREQIRDQFPKSPNGDSWASFNGAALSSQPLAQGSSPALRDGEMRLGLYFPRPEIVPNLPSGQWRYAYSPSEKQLRQLDANVHEPEDARNIIESQMLSLRLRSHQLVHPPNLQPPAPAQPRRIYLVGGGSNNAAIAQIAGEVLGGIDGVYRLDIGGNACALGGAYKACWGAEREDASETFESFVGKRWDEGQFIKKVADGYVPERHQIFDQYGQAVEGFAMMEQQALEEIHSHH